MSKLRLPARDPRTVARDIPGILDALFPELTAGVVLHLNRIASSSSSCEAIDEEILSASALPSAMLFELAVAVGEQLIAERTIDWGDAINIATRRQRRHFDAKPPASITNEDRYTAECVAHNLLVMVKEIAAGNSITQSPRIPGYQWIASGTGDLAVGSKLLEIKCTARSFGAPDYRQVLMYWLLSYADSIENDNLEWADCVLVNPRRNAIVNVRFNDLIKATSAGRTKVELLELFSFLVGDRSGKRGNHA